MDESKVEPLTKLLVYLFDPGAYSGEDDDGVTWWDQLELNERQNYRYKARTILNFLDD